MIFKRKTVEPEQRQNPGPEIGGGNLGQLRLAGEELLAAGAEAINLTLSSDSEAFLEATTQQGGE